MSSTGGKTSVKMLDPLTLSVGDLVCLYPQIENHRINIVSDSAQSSYELRLQEEHRKTMQNMSALPPSKAHSPVDAGAKQLLKLKYNQIHGETPPSNKPFILKDPVISTDCKISISTNAKTELIVDDRDIEPKIIVAPRASPFSEKAYVRVKVTSIPITVNGHAIETDASEHVCWMQRDAIKHYLTIQDIERRRESLEGAMYSSHENDA